MAVAVIERRAHYELREKLDQCSLRLRGMFLEMKNFMELSHPYGFLDISFDDLAEEINVQRDEIYKAVWELRKIGLLRRSASGKLYSPVLIREMLIKGTK